MGRNILDEAGELLKKCDVVTLASINEAGCPRICAMSKIKAEGIRTVWMATGNESAKTVHFRKNPKASICYYLDHDSVTLVGEFEIIHCSLHTDGTKTAAA